MDEHNIFKIHHETTSRIEPLHSRYLAACLRRSLELLERFWILCTNNAEGWQPPRDLRDVKVVEEHPLGDAKRVDIVLVASDRLIAVETKTTDASVKPGQLEEYLAGLRNQYPDRHLWMVYLTPFNRPLAVLRPRAVDEFEGFHSRHPLSSHVSWEEVADLAWGQQDEVWRQHREYVKGTICDPPTAKVGWGGLDKDFGWEVMRDFWNKVSAYGFHVEEGKVILTPGDDPEALAAAFKLLITSERVQSNPKSIVRSLERSKMELFTKDPHYGKVHDRIFRLLDEFQFLGIRGEGGYGLLLPCVGRPRAVSICTCKPNRPQLLIIGRKPK